MLSTFHALETARRAMMTQQYALHTTGHNIANANTEGYTRQRVNFTQTESYPSVGRNSPSVPGNLGTGVKAGSVQRIREEFLDVQYRNETNKVGYWQTRNQALTKMEDILNEPSEQGLSQQIDLFWTALQDLSADSEDAGARSVVRQRAVAVAETFNFLHDSLTMIQNDYQNEIEIKRLEINSLLSQLDLVNEQIRKTEPHGYVTNDLYDEQDRLLDQLSNLVNIQVQRVASVGNTNPAAEGAVTVTLIDDQGKPVQNEAGQPINLVDGTGASERAQFEIEFQPNAHFVTGFTVREGNGTGTNVLNTLPRGEMKALIEAYGYGTSPEDVTGVYPNMLKELNSMAEVFATEMNNIHSIGFTLADQNGVVHRGGDLFDLSGVGQGVGAAKAIKLDSNIQASLNNIAASSVNINSIVSGQRQVYQDLVNAPRDQQYFSNIVDFLTTSSNFTTGAPTAFAGDGTNAKRLADVKDTTLSFSNDSGTISTYYQGVIGDMAVSTQEAGRMMNSSLSLQDSVEYRRQSVSNVSLDEEMTMMIQYQHAYNAAARNITMVDEMLDRIINGMGVVGR
ncbi:flagellar hook-associated protein FlgK [Halalkalibacter krulwichiae]|uniref:Flagellar hook-associated protein 1 n=1 Tax=Halalkalibacter krulwichiae TaxID=199441 RepID=A0A1X9MF86_9BACI|nr:flagellar hook-associated protein FlgK [Halalkalibacter krulwichiae]ARK32098.1 Flagellar hook-associated protein 1 [Halalkalibacter krulwichiae]